mmetsp:Transcript_63409/g.183703  ORF Transcript_63409/g.183703 Transcript_63409/m.183703 type:complete len:746 (-) Transcript_63409:152-2389(-)
MKRKRVGVPRNSCESRWGFHESDCSAASWYLRGWVAAEVVFAALFQILWWFEVQEFGGAQISVPMFISAAIRFLCLVISLRKAVWMTTLAMACMLIDVMLLSTCHPSASPHMAWGIAPPCAPRVVDGQGDFVAAYAAGHQELSGHASGICTPLPVVVGVPDVIDEPGAYMEDEFVDEDTPEYIEREENTGYFEELYSGEYIVDAQEANDMWLELEGKHHRMAMQDHVLVNHCLHMLTWYTVLFVLSLRQAMAALPLSGLLYWAIVVGLGPAAPLPAQEITLTSLSWVLLLVTKRALERSQRKIYELMEQQRLEVVNQKIKRCEAEFKHEIIMGGLPCATKVPPEWPQAFVSQAPGKPDAAATATAAARSKAAHTEVEASHCSAPSAQSAPARLITWLEAACGGGGRPHGDCIPADAEVWVEGAVLPKCVRDVAAGERVLCYDSIGRGPRFVAVTEARIVPGETLWVDVALADGTTTTMTADHPVRAQGTSAHIVAGHMRAQDLIPGRDKLFVMKLVPEEVKTVNFRQGTSTPEAKESSRVALMLQQPHRYEVFVSPSSPHSPGVAGVALGSADARVELGASPVATRTRHTFLEFVMETRNNGRRAASEPAGSHGGCEAATLQRGYQTIRAGESFGTKSESVSISSPSADPAEVVIGFDGGNNLKASEFLEFGRKGCPSLGSRAHAEGRCLPCVFENRHQWRGREPCCRGFLCDRCHMQHESLARPSGAQRRSKARGRPPGELPPP